MSTTGVRYRISLTGAQGTGKSTVARAIADRLRLEGCRDMALYSGVGTQVAHGGLRTGSTADREGVLAFARLHVAREAAASEAVQIFDRCLLDTLAYAHVLACLSPAELGVLRRGTIASCGRLSRLLWLRVTVDYPVQSADDETPEFRRAIDVAIGTLAREHAIALVEHAIPPDRIDDIASTECGLVRAR